MRKGRRVPCCVAVLRRFLAGALPETGGAMESSLGVDRDGAV